MTAAAKTARTAAVKVPGEVGATPMTAAGETDADAVLDQVGELDDGAPQAVITLTPAQLDAAIARGIAQHQAQLREAGKAPEPELPDQSTIDPDKITTPTLSKQGYVVPRHYGVPAAAIQPLLKA